MKISVVNVHITLPNANIFIFWRKSLLILCNSSLYCLSSFPIYTSTYQRKILFLEKKINANGLGSKCIRYKQMRLKQNIDRWIRTRLTDKFTKKQNRSVILNKLYVSVFVNWVIGNFYLSKSEIGSAMYLIKDSFQ